VDKGYSQLVRALVGDSDFQRAFAADPSAALERRGIRLSAETRAAAVEMWPIWVRIPPPSRWVVDGSLTHTAARVF
jgi:hypothetical protein